MRSCSAVKSSPPFFATTISPSSTQRAGNCARNGSSNSGKERVSDFSSRLLIRISPPSRKTNARNPSHFGSKIHVPPTGNSPIRLESIGKIGGITRRRTVQRGLITAYVYDVARQSDSQNQKGLSLPLTPAWSKQSF